MGLLDTSRNALGARIGIYRRLLAFKERVNENHARIVEMDQLLAEVDQRTLALTHQVDRLSELIETLDPQGTRDIAVGVRDSVRSLTVELTEQANRTSRILADLETERTGAAQL